MADMRLRFAKAGIKYVDPFLVQGPDGSKYALPQVHVATIDPTRFAELVEHVARRSAFITLAATHGTDKALEMVNKALEEMRVKAEEQAAMEGATVKA